MTESTELEDGESRSGAGTPSRRNSSGEGLGNSSSEDRFDDGPLDDDPRVVIGLNRFIDALIQSSDRD